MSMDSNLKPTVTTAPAAPTKPSVPATPQAQTGNASAPKAPVAEPVAESVVEIPFVHGYDPKNEYNGAPMVTLRLKYAHTMQYDAVFKLKLDSTEPVRCPLTPFFAGRINQTIILSA